MLKKLGNVEEYIMFDKQYSFLYFLKLFYRS